MAKSPGGQIVGIVLWKCVSFRANNAYMVSTRFSKSKCRTVQDNEGHFGAFLQDIDIAKCRTLQDISPEKMKNAGQCRTFLPSAKNTELNYFLS